MSYLNAGAGRRSAPYREQLPFIRGKTAGLPADCPPLLLTADLQGRTDFGDGEGTLLGCAIPEALGAIEQAHGLPPVQSCLALLAGDFYTDPNACKRGGTGPVDAVWASMEDAFAEVLGVAGNHDSFRHRPGGLMDGHCLHLGGLRVAGVSGILGSRNKPNRRTPDAYRRVLRQALSEDPHILILHSAPHVDEAHPGSPELTKMLTELGFAGLLVCGHVGWKQPLQHIGRCTCVNAHEAVILLEPS